MEGKYQVEKNVLSEEACLLLATEMKVCRSAEILLGTVTPEIIKEGDTQASNCFAKYGSLGNDTLLLLLNQKVNEVFGEELDPTYSYSRIYENGATMPKHTDRPECTHSVTICLEKDKDNTPYPIYMDGEEIELEVGDAIFYKGDQAEHWRNAYEGSEHIQLFLHYTPKDSGLIYDSRPFVGMPKKEV